MTNATCAPYGAACDPNKKYCVCVTPVCTPGQDQTCNDNIMFSSFHGHCNAFSACTCTMNFMKNPQTGKCL